MSDELMTLKPALLAELERLRQTDVGRRIAAIEVLLGDYTPGAADVTYRLEQEIRDSKRQQPARRGTGVSEAKLTAVRQYMQAKGEVRQVEISRDLEENSGSVSLALRALEAEGVIRDTGKVENKSKRWEWVGDEAVADKPKGGGGTRINLGTAGHTTPGDRDAKRIAENLRYTTEEPQ